MYQKWIDSNGTDTFPNGENPENFRKRCCEAFLKIIGNYNNIVVSMIMHGGTIMSLMEKFSVTERDYYGWNVKNGSGFVVEYSAEKITVLEEI